MPNLNFLIKFYWIQLKPPAGNKSKSVAFFQRPDPKVYVEWTWLPISKMIGSAVWMLELSEIEAKIGEYFARIVLE